MCEPPDTPVGTAGQTGVSVSRPKNPVGTAGQTVLDELTNLLQAIPLMIKKLFFKATLPALLCTLKKFSIDATVLTCGADRLAFAGQTG